MDRSAAGRFHELDVLRGVAATAVMFSHYLRHGTHYYSNYPLGLSIGRYGVHLFFVISGFVIYYTLERSRTVQDFLFSRFSRLYPTYWVVVAMLAVWSALADPRGIWWGGYIVNSTMLQKFLGFPDIDVVYWSLAIELCFYAVMALMFFLGQRNRMVWLGIGWMLLAAFWGGLMHHYTGPDERSVATTYLILPYCPYFVVGTMFYLAYSRGWSRAYLLTIGLALGVIAVVHGFTVTWVSALIFAFVAAAVAGWLRFLVSPITLWLGAISYPLYLVHRLPGYAALDWMHAHDVPHLVALFVVVPSALLLAHVLSITVERPALHALRTWYRYRHTQRGTAS